MKSDFIVLISHELRTPINLITGYTHLLNHHKQTELDDSEDQQYLANLIRGLNEGVTRLGDLVGEVISVANIAGGMLDLDLSLIDLSTMMGEILTDFHEVQSARGLTIHVTNVDELPIIEGDKTQLKVALKNLVGNAIKYTPDGGEIYVEGEKLTEMVHFTFSDTGIGIPPEEQSKIFEHFYSLNPIEYHSTSKHAFQGGGLGLGLAITKGVIEAHGGRISVDSAGQDSDSMPGSSFHVFIPLRQSARL
jgi:signal transduction histidine kinase